MSRACVDGVAKVLGDSKNYLCRFVCVLLVNLHKRFLLPLRCINTAKSIRVLSRTSSVTLASKTLISVRPLKRNVQGKSCPFQY